jgi:two-component system NtrC family response regulator
MEGKSILVVDDEPNSLFALTRILEDEGYRVVTADNGKNALTKLKKEMVNVIVTDERMPDFGGMELLKEVKQTYDSIPVILLTAFGSVDMAVEALKEGAFYFFEKPVANNLERFITIINQAVRTQSLEAQVHQLRKEVSEKYSFSNIVGKSRQMLEIFEIIDRVAPTDKTVLIQGESGTGKELIAKAIHSRSVRGNRPMVTVACGAITDSLLTSELFGHSKGAFTGAVKDQLGRFEMAQSGTLFLDEISEIPLNLQKRLLRILQEKEFQRVGSSRTIRADVRVIAVTNKDLYEEVKGKRFRQDLYYRLSVVPMNIPPLRERKEDIPLLIKHFLDKYHEGKRPIRMLPEVVEKMKQYPWPGNVRELENVVQQMILFCENKTITTKDLPPQLFSPELSEDPVDGGKISLGKMVSDIEKMCILRKLHQTNWHLHNTAKNLGITRKMLSIRMAKYGIKRPRKDSRDESMKLP